MAAGWDGVPVLAHSNGHTYFPGTWLAVNYPETREVVEGGHKFVKKIGAL